MMALQLPALTPTATPTAVEPQTSLAVAALPEFLQLLQELPLPGLRSGLPPDILIDTPVSEAQTAADPGVMVPLLLDLLAMARAPVTYTEGAVEPLAPSALPVNAVTIESAAATSPDAAALAALELAPVEASGLEVLSPRGTETAAPRVAPPPVATPDMTVPPGNPRWAEDVGERVLWAMHRGIGTAEIKLNPLELGRVEVRLQLDGDQARVQFSVTQVQAAAALEQALPRLRELFAQEGLNLAQAQVSAQAGQDHARQTPAPLPSVVTGHAAESATGLPADAVPLRRRQGLLDDYA